ncbi:MAG: serine hydrolase domain-containing protein [Gammaproteobacteria bacterium]
MKTFALLSAATALCAVASAAAYARPATDRCADIAANAGGMRDDAWFDGDFEEKLEDMLADTDAVAGLALAVVKDADIIFMRGFGYRDLSACSPVTPDTRFYLKSTTKSFTGLLGALLHEEGVIELDAPITEYLPELSLPAPLNAAQISLRAHLTHGIPYENGGVVFRTAYAGNLPDDRIVGHLSTYSVPKDTRFEYSNLGPIVAAIAMGSAAGASWRDLLEAKVFAPAGMADSFAYMAKAQRDEMSQAYIRDADGRFQPTFTKYEEQMHPAGGTVSTAADLARWLILNLNDGRIDGRRVYPARAIAQAHARQIQLDWTWGRFHRFAHGLGVYSADYEGELVMHHFGGETHVSFMPEHGFGVAVLTNQIDVGLYVTHSVATLIYDHLLEKPDIDARFAAAADNAREKLSERSSEVRAALDDVPSGDATLAPAELAGRYVSDRLGEIVVAVEEGNALTVAFGVLRGELTHVGMDVYLADYHMWGDPPEPYEFRRHGSEGSLLLDWDGRIFFRR